MSTHPDFLGKQVGVVEVSVGASVIRLPISTLRFSRDVATARDDVSGKNVRPAGGFFDDGDGHVGIIVDSDATPVEANEQIRVAVQDALTHFNRRALN